MKVDPPESFFDGPQLKVAQALLKGDAEGVRQLAAKADLNSSYDFCRTCIPVRFKPSTHSKNKKAANIFDATGFFMDGVAGFEPANERIKTS